MNCVPAPPSEAGLFIAAGPSSSGEAHSPPTPKIASPIFISACPTRPSLSVTRIDVSNPNAFSSQCMAAIGSL